MNEHSFSAIQPSAAVRRRPPAPPLPKRDAILRAAIDVFAGRGFFNAQVADVARAAGVAAGTVYLYFRSKDDLLVSVFERSMREALEEGRQAIAASTIPPSGSAASRGCTSAGLAATAISPSSSRSSSGSRSSSWSASRRRSSGSTSGQIRAAIVDGQERGQFRRDINPTTAAKAFFGALDEMATNWILSRRRYSLESHAEPVARLCS